MTPKIEWGNLSVDVDDTTIPTHERWIRAYRIFAQKRDDRVAAFYAAEFYNTPQMSDWMSDRVLDQIRAEFWGEAAMLRGYLQERGKTQ